MKDSVNEVVRSRSYKSDVIVSIVRGDITSEPVDAIVNAANSHLAHGGGVAGAIVRRGGQIIQTESNAKAPVPVGHATFTTAGTLPPKFVIHTVGPRWGEGDEYAKLASAVRSALEVAVSDKVRATSISLPAISTGIFGFPLDRAVRIIFEGIRTWLDESGGGSLREIRLCLFDQPTVDAFVSEFDNYFGE